MDKRASSRPDILPFRQAADLIAHCEGGPPRSPFGRDGQPVDSWLDYCEQFGIFQFFTREFVEGVAELIQEISPRRTLEICAGAGELAAALRELGVDVVATDAHAEMNEVERLTAEEALVRIQPDFVIGCWVPFDAGLDVQVLRCPSVRFYLYINQMMNGLLGSEAMWREPGWRARHLKEIERFGLCRFDFFMGLTPSEQSGVVQHSRVVIFERQS